jgi:hypothetical protein
MRAVLTWFALLTFLLADAGLPAVAAEPNPTPTTPPTLDFANKVLFVLAVGADPGTNARISVALASELRGNNNNPITAERKKLTKSPFAPIGAYVLTNDATAVVPEGGWGLNDYITQCKLHPASTEGAFIVLPPSTGSDTENYLVLVRENATIAFNALIADCELDPKDATAGVPKVLWASDTTTGRYGRSTLQFLPFAVLTSAYLAFAPQRTYQTTTTRAYPTPNPLPKGGAQSSEQTVNSSVLNPSGTGTLQTDVVTSVAGAQLAFGRQGNPDHLLMHAAEDAAGRLLQLVKLECAPAKPTPPTFCAW